uniref:Uncharacterized protein n=1 Tax=Mola mola TaxID=94237 RepID=A0A3Q4AQI4_MOLML
VQNLAPEVVVVSLWDRYLICSKERRTEKPWQRHERCNNPHSGTNSPADSSPVDLAGLHRSHDHHVAVHTDANQEEDAGVEAQLLKDVDNFAQCVSEHPAFGDRGCPEWESDGQQEVDGFCHFKPFQ